MSEERARVEARAVNGLITRDMARQAGMTDPQIDRRVRSGQWVTWPVRGSYLLASNATDPVARLHAATFTLSAVAFGRSALALWGLGEFPDPPVVVRGMAFSGSRVRVVRYRRPETMDVVVRLGVPTVRLEEAIASAASIHRQRSFDGLIDRAIRERRTSWERLEPVLADYRRRGRRGSALLGRVLADRTHDRAIPLSDWSRDFGRALEGAGLSRPMMEWRICDASGSLVAQVDLAYPAFTYAVELDSVEFHLNRDAFEIDRLRDSALARQGWLVRRFTWRQWTEDWELVVATIRADLEGRGLQPCRTIDRLPGR